MPFWERWGMVGFVGFGNVAPSISELGFDNLKSSWGIGLRYAAMPHERLNIRVDFGFRYTGPGVLFKYSRIILATLRGTN